MLLKEQTKAEPSWTKKYVYVISHPSYPGEYKVGIAKNVRQRLNAYQTSDPNRAYKLEYSLLVTNYRETERHIHATFENKHEWVLAPLSDIVQALEGYGAKE